MAWENQLLRREVSGHFAPDRPLGRSPSMQDIVKMIMKVAPTPTTVLISGESGVGKEVVARTIHANSSGKDNVFLPVNCSAIPENLLESQLFGHMKGSFTGAVNSQEGLFQRARGGTIFLDEIGEMPLSLQPKLLRVLEEKTVLPVGFDDTGKSKCAHSRRIQSRPQSGSRSGTIPGRSLLSALCLRDRHPAAAQAARRLAGAGGASDSPA